jgi:hypothetical protein
MLSIESYLLFRVFNEDYPLLRSRLRLAQCHSCL